ncbi:MAG: hypothetical protein ACQKBT_00185 [Puniceicoccales bacterium]
MSRSSDSFDQVCNEVRAQFPSAFQRTDPGSLEEGEEISSWIRSCVAVAGLKQVMAEPRKSSGSVEMLLGLVQEARRQRVRMVWIDPCDCLDPVTAFDRDPSHLLWTRGGGLSGALRVADAVLRDENFPFVCLDGMLLAAEEWKRVPLNRWYRLQRLANRRGASLVLWTPSMVVPAATQRWTLSARWSFPDCLDRSREELRQEIVLMHSEGVPRGLPEERTG